MPVSSSTAFAYNSATISSTAQDLEDIGFTAAQIDRADFAFISCDTQPLRFRYDGTAPTTADGHYLDAGDVWVLYGNSNIRNLQLIAVSTDGFIAITLESYDN